MKRIAHAIWSMKQMRKRTNGKKNDEHERGLVKDSRYFHFAAFTRCRASVNRMLSCAVRRRRRHLSIDDTENEFRFLCVL